MICLLSREQEVSMLTALVFTPRSLNNEQGLTCCHIEMSLQGRGLKQNRYRFVSLVTLRELAMLTGSVFVESRPSTSGMMDC